MTTEIKHDIITKDDVTLLITEFYSKVRTDAQLAPHFINVDWEHHTPIIVDFWSMLLLGEQSYKGNPLAKHLHMSLTKEDFSQWLTLFTGTIDQHFAGTKADEARQRAMSIASIFQFKMGIQ
jgi:hemoglobin